MTRCELAQVDNLQQRSETHGINVLKCELVDILEGCSDGQIFII